jgi:hypothetical protein
MTQQPLQQSGETSRRTRRMHRRKQDAFSFKKPFPAPDKESIAFS